MDFMAGDEKGEGEEGDEQAQVGIHTPSFDSRNEKKYK